MVSCTTQDLVFANIGFIRVSAGIQHIRSIIEVLKHFFKRLLRHFITISIKSQNTPSTFSEETEIPPVYVNYHLCHSKHKTK